MKTWRWINSLPAVLALMLWAHVAGAEPVRIFAAASLQGPLDQIAETWPGGARISYGGSGAIARQVQAGAPADLVILANGLWMDWLQQTQALPDPPRDVVGNSLVLVGTAGAAALNGLTAPAILDRLAGNRLAMGEHRSVPAGQYARQWMEHADLWGDLRPHLAETENVRAALVLVTRGEVPLAIVYASDAKAAGGSVTVLAEIPAGSHDPVRYPAAALTDAGRAFLDRLTAQVAVFEAAGFEVLP